MKMIPTADRLTPIELARYNELAPLVANPEKRSPPNSDLSPQEIAEWVMLRDKRYSEDK